MDTAAMTVMTYRQALQDTLRAEMLRDEDVFLMGEEIGVFEGSYKITAGLLKEFGAKRVRDTPIAEEGFVGAAIGAAMLGLRPVVEIMTINFSLLALDQIVNHAAKIYGMFGGQCQRADGDPHARAAAASSSAPRTRRTSSCSTPSSPASRSSRRSTPAEAPRCSRPRSATTTRCCSWRTSRSTTPSGEVPRDAAPAEIGKAAVTREGTDITIIAYSRMAHVATEVAGRLAAEGVSAEVVDLRSLRPLDRETIVDSVRRTGSAVIAEDDWLTYGIGAEIAASISGGRLRLPRRPGTPRRDGRGAAAVRQAARTRRAAVGRLPPHRRTRHAAPRPARR